MLIIAVLGVLGLLVASSSAAQGWAKDFVGAKVDEFLGTNKKNLGSLSQEARDIYRQLLESKATLVQGLGPPHNAHLNELESSKSLETNRFIKELLQAWLAEKCAKFDALGLDLTSKTIELNASKLGSIVQLNNAVVQKLNQICTESGITSGEQYRSFISCSPRALKVEYLPSSVVFGQIFGFSIGAMILLSFRKQFGVYEIFNDCN